MLSVKRRASRVELESADQMEPGNGGGNHSSSSRQTNSSSDALPKGRNSSKVAALRKKWKMGIVILLATVLVGMVVVQVVFVSHVQSLGAARRLGIGLYYMWMPRANSPPPLPRKARGLDGRGGGGGGVVSRSTTFSANITTATSSSSTTTTNSMVDDNDDYEEASLAEWARCRPIPTTPPWFSSSFSSFSSFSSDQQPPSASATRQRGAGSVGTSLAGDAEILDDDIPPPSPAAMLFETAGATSASTSTTSSATSTSSPSSSSSHDYGWRCLPNVVFLGASKCGTSSLRSHLVAHPGIRFQRRMQSSVEGAEVHRFDRWDYPYSLMAVEKALEWGHAPPLTSPHAPLVHYTPHYMYPSELPSRMHAFYPHARTLKFVVMLRDPVKRAMSSYWFKQPNEAGGSPLHFHTTSAIEIRRRRGYERCLAEALWGPSEAGRWAGNKALEWAEELREWEEAVETVTNSSSSSSSGSRSSGSGRSSSSRRSRSSGTRSSSDSSSSQSSTKRRSLSSSVTDGFDQQRRIVSKEPWQGGVWESAGFTGLKGANHRKQREANCFALHMMTSPSSSSDSSSSSSSTSSSSGSQNIRRLVVDESSNVTSASSLASSSPFASSSLLPTSSLPRGADTSMEHHLSKGLYAEQLDRWFQLFDSTRFFVLSLEGFHMGGGVTIYSELCAFLGVPAVGEGGFPSAEALKRQLSRRFNEGSNPSSSPMHPQTLALLKRFFRPYSSALFDLLGARFEGWGT